MTEVELEILEYCRPYIKFMWAAKIASIILGCDFRDVETKIKKHGNLTK